MYCKKVNEVQKYQQVVDYGLKENGQLSFKYFNLSNEMIKQNTKNEEGMLIIFLGKALVKIDNQEFLLRRKNVFEDNPEAIYIPINSNFEIIAEEKFEAALVSSPCEEKQRTYFIAKEDIDVNISGKKEWKRKVRMIAKPTDKTFKLIIGEGLNLPGRWSGMPPHKHDTEGENESVLKEIYFFKINPNTLGYGLMTVYDKEEKDELYKIKSNDLIFISKGYHSIVSTPGTELYFLWVLAGPIKVYKTTIDKEFKKIE